jgi:tripartite-type tricarboxylate transporter receptor subunit TctC
MQFSRPSRRAVLSASLAAPFLGHVTARAQGTWSPSRPIRLVVGFTPAGTTDIAARLLVEPLSQRLGQQVVIENRPGAGGNVGADVVAKADPDGLTILMQTISSGAINYQLYGARMPYKPEDFAGISLVIRVPNAIFVNPAVPANTLAELVALAKANPGKLNIGSSPHVCMELLSQITGIRLVHVPFRGSGPMLTELMAERVDCGMDNIPSALPFIRDGQIRALGMSGASRASVAPNVPVIAESIPGFEATAWFGVQTSARVPRAAIERIGVEIDMIARNPAFRARLAEFGADGPGLTPEGGSSPAAFEAFLAAEIRKWAEVVQKANLTAS